MSSASLLDLPVEILHQIFDFLDLSTIHFSLTNVCQTLRNIVLSYNRHDFDFTSTSKRNFHRLCQQIDPVDVISLKLSDDHRTPGQISLFFSFFNLQQFVRLRFLSLVAVDDDELNKMLEKSFPLTLTSFAVHWRRSHSPSENTLSRLTSILSQLKLHRLDLLTKSFAFETMLWPQQNHVEHLNLIYITHRQLCFLFRQFPKLKTLKLNNCSMHLFDDDDDDGIFPTSLKSLTLNECRLSFNSLVSILSLTQKLTHLKLIGSVESFETIADGFRWENFIRLNLIFLSQFEFFFTNIFNVYFRSNDLDALIERFQTKFWIEEKRWDVVLDFVVDLHQVKIFTIPICTNEFSFESKTRRMTRSNSTSTTSSDHFQHIRTFETTLTNFRNVSSTISFPNVTKLTIDVDENWPNDFVENLSKFIDLTRLEKIELNPDLTSNSFEKTVEVVKILFERSTRFDSLSIQPIVSKNQKEIFVLKNFCSLIPQHVKHLEISIRNIETMAMIVESLRHLSSVSFFSSNETVESIQWTDFLSFFNENTTNLTFWSSFYSFHLWLK